MQMGNAPSHATLCEAMLVNDLADRIPANLIQEFSNILTMLTEELIRGDAEEGINCPRRRVAFLGGGWNSETSQT